MSKKCTNCGAEIADDALFCTECGTKVEAATETVNSQTQEASVSTPVAPVSSVSYTAPSAVTYDTQRNEETAPVMKTAAFFWLDVLYCVPFVGLIACIIICAAAKNPNMRHHAASKLIELLVGLILSIIAVIICVVAVKQVGLNIDDILNSNSISSFY